MSPSHCHVTKRSQNVTIAMNPLSNCFYALTVKFDFTRLARLIRDYIDVTVFNCHKSYLPISWTLEISLRLAVVCLLCLIIVLVLVPGLSGIMCALRLASPPGPSAEISPVIIIRADIKHTHWHQSLRYISNELMSTPTSHEVSRHPTRWILLNI